MRQPIPYQTIQVSAAQCADNHDDKRYVSVTDINKHRAGASTGKRPAKAKYQAADDVLYPAFFFIGKYDWIALRVFDVILFNEENR